MRAVRLMQVGEEFSGAKSESLEESIRRQSLNYFRSYHRAKLDELHMFLENEGWELCPVKPTFSILMLQVGTLFNPLTMAHSSRGLYGTHTDLYVQYPLRSTVLDAGSVWGLPAHLCCGPMTATSSVLRLIFRDCRCDRSSSTG